MNKRLITCSILFLYLIGFGSVAIAEENTTYIYPPWKHTWGVVKATPLKLRMFVGNETKFNDPQGIAVARLDSWDDPDKTGDDDEITAYGVNSGDNCILYNRSMYKLGIYGLEDEHEKLAHPWGIAADAKGNVYVADRGNARVVRLFNPKNNLEFVSIIGGPGIDSGRFVDPRGVALDSDGRLYVTDTGLGRVSVFDNDGKLIQIWNGFDSPDGIAVVSREERWNYYRWASESPVMDSIDPSLDVPFAVVIDSSHQRIRKISLDGRLIAETRASDWGVSDAHLAYVALDYHNQLLITDRNNGRIHKLDRNLNYLTSFGQKGEDKDYHFDELRGIAIFRRFGQIIVTEREGAQYLWVAVDVPKFGVVITQDTTTIVDSVLYHLDIRFTITEPAYCSFDILDDAGRFITRLTRSKRRYNAGEGNYTWWGVKLPKKLLDNTPKPPSKYKLSHPLPKGSYSVKATFSATYSSRDHFQRTETAHFKIG